MMYMMHSPRLLPLLAAVAMVTTILSPSLKNTATAEEDQPIYMNYTCSPKLNFTDDSPYGKNLADLLSTLSTPPSSSPSTVLDNWWFRSRTVVVGSGDPNQSSAAVSGLAMCYADSDERRCRSCLTAAASVLTDLCSHSRNASFISSGGCVVRYADGEPFFGSAAADFDTTLFLRSYNIDGDAMRETRQALLSRLAEIAGGDDGDGGLRFAAGSQAFVDGDGDEFRVRHVMYGMAQCTRDLPMSACSGCLFEHLATMYKETEMINSSGAVVMGLSCHLSYQVDKPIDIAGLPQAPSPAPAPTTPTGSSAAPAPTLVGKTMMMAFGATLAVTLLNVVAGV